MIYRVITQVYTLLHHHRHKIEYLLLALFLISYTFASILVSLNRFWQYDAFWYDFGILDETIWKLAHFKLPIIRQLAPPIGMNVWGDHFNPTLIFLAPLYWLTKHAEVMLITQVIVVLVSGLVLYDLSLRKVKSSVMRIALMVAYFGYVGLQNALYTDIHNTVFALLPLSILFWSFYLEKWKVFWVSLILLLGVQENMAVIGLGIAFYMVIKDRKYLKKALLVAVISLAWAYGTTQYLMPFIRKSSYSYQPTYPLGVIEWGRAFIFPIQLKLRVILVTFTTFGWLPLLSLSTLPLILGQFIERFVLNTASTRWDLGLHYNAVLSPIFFIGALETVVKFQKHIIGRKVLALWGGVVILLAISIHELYYHGPLKLAYHPVFYEQTKRLKFLKPLLDNVPEKGLLMTQNNLAAQFTHRETVLLSKQFIEISPDIIVMDTRPGQNANNFFPLTPYEFDNLVASVSANKNYTKREIIDSQLIFVKKKLYTHLTQICRPLGRKN